MFESSFLFHQRLKASGQVLCSILDTYSLDSTFLDSLGTPPEPRISQPSVTRPHRPSGLANYCVIFKLFKRIERNVSLLTLEPEPSQNKPPQKETHPRKTPPPRIQKTEALSTKVFRLSLKTGARGLKPSIGCQFFSTVLLLKTQSENSPTPRKALGRPLLQILKKELPKMPASSFKKFIPNCQRSAAHCFSFRSQLQRGID